jgi:hypothetical protein
MALVAELVELGCADPAVDCEVFDPATGEVLAIAEACWPEGLRPGEGDPVILELAPAETDLDRLRELGYEVFTSADALRSHARRRNGQNHQSRDGREAAAVGDKAVQTPRVCAVA